MFVMLLLCLSWQKYIASNTLFYRICLGPGPAQARGPGPPGLKWARPGPLLRGETLQKKRTLFCIRLSVKICVFRILPSELMGTALLQPVRI